MLKVLVPVDGSPHSERVINYIVSVAQHGCTALEVHVLNVQEAVEAWEVKRFMHGDEIDAVLVSRGGDALARSRELLELGDIAYTPHVKVGSVAETIARTARELGVHHIVMGTRAMGATGNLLLGSVATKVVHLADVPVTLIK